MIYSRTQPCCEDCWEKHNPSREAIRLNGVELEECVYCRAYTSAGIYVEIDPAIAPHPTVAAEEL